MREASTSSLCLLYRPGAVACEPGPMPTWICARPLKSIWRPYLPGRPPPPLCRAAGLCYEAFAARPLFPNARPLRVRFCAALPQHVQPVGEQQALVWVAGAYSNERAMGMVSGGLPMMGWGGGGGSGHARLDQCARHPASQF